MKNRIAAALLVSLAFGLPSFAAAGVTAGTTQTQGNPDRDAWMSRISAARERVTVAQNNYTSALRRYGQMKRRDRARGEDKLDILAVRKAARAEVTEAEQDLDTLLEEARREGVPPGWLRDAMAGADPAAPAN